jgi:MYXO-CTERM domain-containing protein
MKNLAIVALLAVTGSANAQYSFTGSTITENFDGLLSASSPFSSTIGVQANVPGLAWVGTKNAGTGTTAMPYTTDTGAGNSGGIYNYGIAAGNTDRALGALASGSNAATFGVAVTNNSGAAITAFTLNFNSEQYRDSTSSQNFLTFGYATSALAGVTDSNFLTFAGFTANAAADVIGNNATTGTQVALNPPSLRTYSVTISGLNVPVGSKIYLRWSDFNDVGNDAGLAIDDFRFSAVPTPGATALLGLAGVAALRRRRA